MVNKFLFGHFLPIFGAFGAGSFHVEKPLIANYVYLQFTFELFLFLHINLGTSTRLKKETTYIYVIWLMAF
jgi:hypothetical protein